MTGGRTNFTAGGLNKFGYDDLNVLRKVDEKNDVVEVSVNKGRAGWYGWFGSGGSVMQWHPELKIGFAYVPADHMFMDFYNNRGGRLQTLVAEIA